MTRFERLPVRWRLALTSAGLTFAILLLFALVIGVFTAREVNASFDNGLRLTADNLQTQISLGPVNGLRIKVPEETIRAIGSGDAAVRFLSEDGVPLPGQSAADLGPPRSGLHNTHGFRVATRILRNPVGHPIAFLQYARRLSGVHHTIARVRLFLLFGVIAGTLLALLAGLGLARRAIAPIASLTRAAKDIARTRDPAVRMPKPRADDEVADLARTLEEMLMALDAARGDTQAALDRQRQFVADASHELRTPLTSILANLELLQAGLAGEDAEIAGSALRSSHRMRRLVADLLLLARADAGQPDHRDRVDLGAVVREAAAEAAPVSAGHEITIDLDERAGPLELNGSNDELHRLLLNLLQNALVHTPAGTSVGVSAQREGDSLTLTVSDDGPGIPADLRPRLFDRFVRSEGDRAGGGSGLGLAIVRAVADSHGGTVSLVESARQGAEFVVTLPAVDVGAPVAPGRAKV
ncbi:MAG: ATP-binding protein [Thermoleophilaceae bacterium]